MEKRHHRHRGGPRVDGSAGAYRNVIELLRWYGDHLALLAGAFFDEVDPSLNEGVRITASVVPAPAAIGTTALAAVAEHQPSTASERLTIFRYKFSLGFAVLAVGLTAFLFWLFFG